MNKRLLFLLCFCSNVFAAETDSLPPVLENSRYYNGEYNQQNAMPAGEEAKLGTNVKGANSTNALYEVMGQLEQIQKELRQLSGTVEEQAHDLAEIKKRQATMYDDLDQRLQGLETAKVGAGAASAVAASPAPTVNTPAAAAPTPPAPAAIDAAVAPTPPPAPAAPQTPAVVAPPVTPAPVATLAPPAPSSQSSANKYPKEIYSEAKETQPPPPVAPKSNEKDQYQSAYDTLRDGHYSQAIEGLKAFLANYPGSEYAANAQYWLGEAYKVKQEINSAREAFNKVITQYPASPKVPDALLKLGYLELEQDNMAKAKDYLLRASSGYPNTTAAHLAAKKLAVLNGAPQ